MITYRKSGKYSLGMGIRSANVGGFPYRQKLWKQFRLGRMVYSVLWLDMLAEAEQYFMLTSLKLF